VKKYLLLLIAFVSMGTVVMAQNDDLPPPTSRPQSAGESNTNDFQGFQPKKKLDLSKFIIEPNVYLMISNNYIMTGFAPFVGYRVYQPSSASSRLGPNTGLYVGGGFTYFYNGYRNLPVQDQMGNVIGKVNANYHTYGPGVFVQYNIWKGFFARLKFETLFRKMDDTNGGVIARDPNNPAAGFYFNKINRVVPGLLLGAGYNLLQSKNFFFPVMVSYNLLHYATDQTYSVYPKNGFVFQLGFITIF
jgi:hypothetical protein